jgi:hypothetical protein
MTRLIVGAALVFIVVLAVSAIFESDIRMLHGLQSLIYVTIIVLAVRHNKWGYAIAIGIGCAWDAYNLFASGFIAAGADAWHAFVTTGRIEDPVAFVALPGGLANAVLVVGSVWAYARIDRKRWSDIGVLIGGSAGVIVYFVGCIALTWPEFIPELRRHLFGG